MLEGKSPSVHSAHTYALGRFSAIAYLSFAVLVGSADILFILRHYTRFPFGDHWAWLERLYHLGLSGALFCHYNEHYLVVPGLFYWLDARLFGGNNSFLIFASMLIQVGGIILLIAPLWRTSEILKPVRYVFAGFVIIIMLWFIQAENFFYPFSLCLSCSNLGLLAALYLFTRSTGQRNGGPAAWLTWLAMFACAFWATFSYGSGILIWPVLLAVGFVLRLPARTLLIILLVFACALGIYFFNYKTPPGHAGPFESLRHPVQVIRYFILVLGLPVFGLNTQDVSLASNIGKYVVTISGILLALALVLRFAVTRAEHKHNEQVFYCSLLLLSMGAAFLAALGRASFPLTQALAGRYAPVPLFFWISLTALVTVYLSRWEANDGLGRAIWCGLLVLASCATLPTQVPVGRYMANRERLQSAAAISIAVGVPDLPRIQEELGVTFLDKIAEASRGYSIFSPTQAAALGTPLRQHFQVAPAGTCLGFVDSADSISMSAPSGARLTGWAWDVSRQRAPSRIWVADSGMIIRGLGITGMFRRDVAAAFGKSGMASTGWIAYSRFSPQGSGELTVFAELGEEGPVCRIGNPHTPAP